MNKSKVIRDAAIIIAIVLLIAVFYRYGAKGPVEKAGNPDMASQDMHDHGTVAHTRVSPELDSGTPIVTLDGISLGNKWLESRTEILVENLVKQGQDEEDARNKAIEAALIEGIYEIVFRNAVKEMGIEADPEEMAEREAGFYAQFESTGEAEELLNEMGVSMERVREMWRKELVEDKLMERIAEENSLEPGSEEAVEAFGEYIRGKIRNAELEFADPAYEEIYRSHLESGSSE